MSPKENLSMNKKDDSKFNNEQESSETNELNGNEQQPNELGYKMTFASVAGNALEMYDFTVFGYYSDVIGAQFFPPNQSESLALIESFAVLGLGFLVRPIGGAIIGKIGDIYSRKRALEISIFVMTFPTVLLGCLPTYSQVGWLSTFLLIFLRVLQGLSVGGQFMAAIIFTLERKTDISGWGLWSATSISAGNVGIAIGGVITSILRESLSREELYSWGWRLPFWLGIFALIPAIYLRMQPEVDMINPSVSVSPNNTSLENVTSEENRNDHEPKRNPLKEALRKSNRLPLLIATLIPTLNAAAYHVLFVWVVIFMTDMIDPPVQHSFTINSILSIIGGIPFPLIAGWMIDRVGNDGVLVAFTSIASIILYPLAIRYIGINWGQDEQPSDIQIVFIVLVLAMLYALFATSQMPFIVTLFPRDIRLTSASLGYNISNATWGGFSPLLATVFAERMNYFAAGCIVSAGALCTFIGVCITPGGFDSRVKRVADLKELEERAHSTETTEDNRLTQPLLP